MGSLKSLEKLIAVTEGDEKAKKLMTPLFGIYDLRLADAHLAAADLKVPLSLVKIDLSQPSVIQGFIMIDFLVWTLVQMIRTLNE